MRIILLISIVFFGSCKTPKSKLTVKDLAQDDSHVDIFLQLASQDDVVVNNQEESTSQENKNDTVSNRALIPLIAVPVGTAIIAGGVTLYKIQKEEHLLIPQSNNKSGITLIGNGGKNLFDDIQGDRVGVAHVGLEFGDSIVGGAGTVMTNLSVSQNANESFRSVAIIPMHQFFDKKNFEEFAHISHSFNGSIVTSKVYVKKYKGTPVFAIEPLNAPGITFSAADASKIYSSMNTQNSLFFDTASAALALHLKDAGINIDIFQVHNSGNANLAMRGMQGNRKITKIRTQHDIIFQRWDKADKNQIIKAFSGIFSNLKKSDLSDSTLINSLKYSDFLAPVSETLKKMNLENEIAGNEIAKEMNASKSKIKVIVNGINSENIPDSNDLIDKKQKAKESLSKIGKEQEILGREIVEDTSKPIYLYVGRWSKEKGIDDLRQAADNIGDKGRLVIMTNLESGAKSDLFDAIKDLPNVRVINGVKNQMKNGLGDTIRLASDISIIPSRAESFGMVALESILYGQIVVTTGVQGLGEVVNDADLVSKYNIDNAESLKNAIDKSYENFNKNGKEQLLISNAQRLRDRFDYNSPKGPIEAYSKILETIPDAKVYKMIVNGIEKKIRFYHTDSPGQIIDKMMYLQSLKDNGYKLEALEDFPISEKVDINFHIEHSYKTSNAKTNIIMVNQEWILPTDRLKNMDQIICRSQLCVDIVKKNVPNYPDDRIKKMTFTSPVSDEIIEKFDYDQFVHAAGKSAEKNTLHLLKTWLKHPEWPPLVVTCSSENFFYGCLNTIKDRLQDFKEAKNIRIMTERLDQEEFKRLNNIGFSIMPSVAEGWGHSINESRAKGQIVITTEGEPMKSHVRDGSGFTVKSKEIGKYYSGCPKLDFDEKSLEEIVERARNLSATEKEIMSTKARSLFLKDTQDFVASFNYFMDNQTGLVPVRKESFALPRNIQILQKKLIPKLPEVQITPEAKPQKKEIPSPSVGKASAPESLKIKIP